MAIRRTGAARPGDRFETQDLGRVRVTIDDLQALIEVMSELQPDAKIRLSARGASFDKPEDLRDLTDRELQAILVETPAVDVRLGKDAAEVSGRPDVVQAVAARWARPRRLQGRPLRWYRDIVLPVPLGLTLGLVVNLFITRGQLELLGWTLGVMPLTSGLIAGWIVSMNVEKYRSYADIQPFTIAEARAEMKAGRRFTTQVVIAVSSAIVGATVAIILFSLRT